MRSSIALFWHTPDPHRCCSAPLTEAGSTCPIATAAHYRPFRLNVRIFAVLCWDRAERASVCGYTIRIQSRELA